MEKFKFKYLSILVLAFCLNLEKAEAAHFPVPLMVNTNGAIIAPSNFLAQNFSAGSNIVFEFLSPSNLIIHATNGGSSGSSYLFNTNQFATNTAFNVDIKKAARLTN